jgi:ParB-like chromosome segregation protein Spo0J
LHRGGPNRNRALGGERKEGSMRVQEIAIAQIKPNPRNARTHSAKQIRQIADSIVAFGFRNPLLVNERGELIAGHGRHQAAKLLGLETVPVLIAHKLSPTQQRSLAIADNRIAENAGWDRARLAIEIPEVAQVLSAEGLDVSILGFEPIEIEHLHTECEPAAPTPRRDGTDLDRID